MLSQGVESNVKCTLLNGLMLSLGVKFRCQIWVSSLDVEGRCQVKVYNLGIKSVKVLSLGLKTRLDNWGVSTPAERTPSIRQEREKHITAV